MPIIATSENYQFVRFTVAGVTHKNGRRSRQTILRRIYWKDEPYNRFDGEKDVGLKLTEFDGQPAVEVWVRGKDGPEQIGWVPKDELPNVVPRMERYAGIVAFSVYGGGETTDGKNISFGATMTARFALTDEEKDQQAAERKREEEVARREAERERQEKEEQRQAEERRQKEEEETRRRKKQRIGTLAALIVIVILLKLLLK